MTHKQEQTEPKQGRTEALSRRGMLRYGAVAAAAAAGAAGSAALGATPAQAAAGDAIKIDSENTGGGVTKLTGTNVDVTASNAKAAITGTGSGTESAGVAAINATGPQLFLSTNSDAVFPPAKGKYAVGAIINYKGVLFQCVESDNAADSATLWRSYGGTQSLTLLPQPVRVYASYKDSQHGLAKIARNEIRQIDALSKTDGTASGVPPWATAVLGSVQLSGTETADGYLAIGSGDAAPSGFSTTVWSSANLSSVTSFTSALGAKDDTLGYLNVAAYSAQAASKTHFMIDIVGYYETDLWIGGPQAAKAPARKLDAKRGAASLHSTLKRKK